ncbi:MAG: GAF domain-containing protein [Phormidesmis sp. CAN_BIN36]|nr:GAF domain-containing protein [Phormidesmis sp. CAN_BIN36]
MNVALQTSAQDLDDFFNKLVAELGESLQCDRCFLYLRHPETKLGKVPFCWVRSSEIPTVYDQQWKPEPKSLASEDPMFAAALRCAPSIFVEDVETADPQVLNSQFEQHRALVHGHLCHDKQLWGVLQPCIFGRPRVWTEGDRAAIAEVIAQITSTAITFIQMSEQTENLP